MRRTSSRNTDYLYGLAACLKEVRVPLVILLLGLFGAVPPDSLSRLIFLVGRALR